MEHQRNDARERVVDGDRDQGPEDHLKIGTHDPRRGEEDRYPNATEQTSAVQGSPPKREATSPWVNWQSALYVLVLGAACLVLVPLTSLWWIVPVLGAVVPIALAVLDRPGPKLGKTDDRKAKERELLNALAERGEITPATAAMRTSLTVDEASKMLGDLAGKGATCTSMRRTGSWRTPSRTGTDAPSKASSLHFPSRGRRAATLRAGLRNGWTIR